MCEFVLLGTDIIVSSVHYLQPAQVYTSAVFGGSVIELNMPFELIDFLVFLTLYVLKYNTLRLGEVRSLSSGLLLPLSLHEDYLYCN
jgi:hypothetical protein